MKNPNSDVIQLVTLASGVLLKIAIVPGLPPLALDAVVPVRHPLSYVTRGPCVVDCTVGACPITCSPRHLTYHLFHSYGYTLYSGAARICLQEGGQTTLSNYR